MSFNNVIPAWVVAGDNTIQLYRKGHISLADAEKKLDDMRVPQSMKNRLYEKKEEQHEQ